MVHGNVRPCPQSNAPCNAMQREIPLVSIVPREHQLGRVRFRDKCSTRRCIGGLPNSVRNRPLYLAEESPGRRQHASVHDPVPSSGNDRNDRAAYFIQQAHSEVVCYIYLFTYHLPVCLALFHRQR